MLNIKRLVCMCFVIAILSGTAFASYITLNTSITSKVDGENLKVLLTLVNKGDEPAYNLQGELLVGGKNFFTEKKDTLGINQEYKFMQEISLTKLREPGQYPLVVTVHYTDANQYPFSALTAQVFNYQSGDRPVEIFGKTQPLTFGKNGTLVAKLKNLSLKELVVKNVLVVPQELTVGSATSLKLPSKTEREIRFPVTNFSALSGSAYQVFIISEYSRDKNHYTTVTPGTIKINQQKGLFGVSYTMVFAAFILLIITFIAAQFTRKK